VCDSSFKPPVVHLNLNPPPSSLMNSSIDFPLILLHLLSVASPGFTAPSGGGERFSAPSPSSDQGESVDLSPSGLFDSQRVSVLQKLKQGAAATPLKAFQKQHL